MHFCLVEYSVIWQGEKERWSKNLLPIWGRPLLKNLLALSHPSCKKIRFFWEKKVFWRKICEKPIDLNRFLLHLSPLLASAAYWDFSISTFNIQLCQKGPWKRPELRAKKPFGNAVNYTGSAFAAVFFGLLSDGNNDFLQLFLAMPLISISKKDPTMYLCGLEGQKCKNISCKDNKKYIDLTIDSRFSNCFSLCFVLWNLQSLKIFQEKPSLLYHVLLHEGFLLLIIIGSAKLSMYFGFEKSLFSFVVRSF